MTNRVKINSHAVAVKNSLEVLNGVHGIVGEVIEELAESGIKGNLLKKLLVCEATLDKQIYEISRCNAETYYLTINKNSVETTTK